MPRKRKPSLAARAKAALDVYARLFENADAEEKFFEDHDYEAQVGHWCMTVLAGGDEVYAPLDTAMWDYARTVLPPDHLAWEHLEHPCGKKLETMLLDEKDDLRYGLSYYENN